MIVLEKNCYKLRSMAITPMKVLKTFLLDAISSSINIPLREKVCKGKQIFMKNPSNCSIQTIQLCRHKIVFKIKSCKANSQFYWLDNFCFPIIPQKQNSKPSNQKVKSLGRKIYLQKHQQREKESGKGNFRFVRGRK